MLAGAGSNGAYSALSTAAAIREHQAEYDSFRESPDHLEKEFEVELGRMEQRARASEEEIRRGKGSRPPRSESAGFFGGPHDYYNSFWGRPI